MVPHAGGTQQLLTYALGNLLIVAAAYLLGSLNFAIIVSKKLYGKDIRKYGSHNAGMTNMFRTFGKKAGLLTLAGDAGKALVSVLLGRLLLGEDGAYLAGLFCILGHIAPAYYRFKGGKGVVVTAVTVAIIDPVIFAVLVVVFALVFLIWRYVSLASVIAGVRLSGRGVHQRADSQRRAGDAVYDGDAFFRLRRAVDFVPSP